MNKGPTWQDVYKLASAEAVAERFRATRHPDWLSLGRGIGRGLGLSGIVARGERPEVDAVDLGPATVFVLGATEGAAWQSGPDDLSGCLGHVTADGSGGRIAGGATRVTGAAVQDAGVVIDLVRDTVVAEVRGLDASIRTPGVELVVPRAGEGDSHALATALAVLHAVWGEPTATGLAATGGFDVESGRFTPVPTSTIGSKLEAARRWGVRTLVMLRDQEIPADAPIDSFDLIRVSADPAQLALAVLELAGRRPGELSPSLVHRALWQYDLRVARSPGATVDSVFSITAPFLASDDRAVANTEAFDGGDPISWLLASDLRSRMLLHAGRTAEAAEWARVGQGGWGRGDLPAGGLGDFLRYQRVAHRSMIDVDLARIDSDADGEAHSSLDRAIDHLDGTWCTTHERLQRLFLANTRWRRRLHLARRDLDRAQMASAWTDLVCDRERWPDLLTTHASVGLGMADTDLARQHNYVLEHLATDRLLSLVDGAGPLDPPVGLQMSPVADASAWLDDDLERDLVGRITRIGALSSFDLRGLLQAFWLGYPVAGGALEEAWSRAQALAEDRIFDAARVADWLIRFDASSLAVSSSILRRALEAVRAIESEGIRHLMALRWFALDRGRAGVSFDLEDLAASVPRPSSVESLATAFDDLVSRPSSLLVRTPY